MAVTKRTRYEVLRRDNHTCRYCGGRAPDVVLTVDHVVPVALGGGDDRSNLVAACQDCNAGKSASSPDGSLVDQVNADAQRWRGAMLLAAADAEVQVTRMANFRAAFHAEWQAWTFGQHRRGCPLPPTWEPTLDRWFVAGLSAALLNDAVRIAMQGPATSDTKFVYLAGVVKRKLAQITTEAIGKASQPIAVEPAAKRQSVHSKEWQAGYKDGWEACEKADRYWTDDVHRLGLRAAVLDPRAA